MECHIVTMLVRIGYEVQGVAQVPLAVLSVHNVQPYDQLQPGLGHELIELRPMPTGDRYVVPSVFGRKNWRRLRRILRPPKREVIAFRPRNPYVRRVQRFGHVDRGRSIRNIMRVSFKTNYPRPIKQN